MCKGELYPWVFFYKAPNTEQGEYDVQRQLPSIHLRFLVAGIHVNIKSSKHNEMELF